MDVLLEGPDRTAKWVDLDRFDLVGTVYLPDFFAFLGGRDPAPSSLYRIGPDRWLVVTMREPDLFEKGSGRYQCFTALEAAQALVDQTPDLPEELRRLVPDRYLDPASVSGSAGANPKGGCSHRDLADEPPTARIAEGNPTGFAPSYSDRPLSSEMRRSTSSPDPASRVSEVGAAPPAVAVDVEQLTLRVAGSTFPIRTEAGARYLRILVDRGDWVSGSQLDRWDGYFSGNAPDVTRLRKSFPKWVRDAIEKQRGVGTRLSVETLVASARRSRKVCDRQCE